MLVQVLRFVELKNVVSGMEILGYDRLRVYQPIEYKKPSRLGRRGIGVVDEGYESVYADWWCDRVRKEFEKRVLRMDDLRWKRLLKGIEIGLRVLGVDEDKIEELMYFVKFEFCSCVVVDRECYVVGIDYMCKFYKFVERIKTD